SNCTGKYSEMLTGVTKQNMQVSTYRDITHPYQQQNLHILEEVAEYDSEKIGISVDGCGVPVHRMPLFKVALLYSRLAKVQDWKLDNPDLKQAIERIRVAMTTYPEMVAGSEQFDTDLMSVFDGRS